MTKSLVLMIPGRLPGLNEYVDQERKNRFVAAKMKREAENLVSTAARQCLRGWKATGPITMRYLWVEPNRRRDKDNISGYGRKVIQDALVKSGYLSNDGWANITMFTDSFAVDASNPRIEVTLEWEEKEGAEI